MMRRVCSRHDFAMVLVLDVNQRDEYIRVSRALRDLRYPFDVFFINTQWFEESKDVIRPANPNTPRCYTDGVCEQASATGITEWE
jgi:hypothetical protein